MSYLVDLHSDVESHVSVWAANTTLVRDNDESKTKGIKEFVRLLVLPGIGSIATRTGIRNVSGSRIRYPVLIRFNIFTDIHTGTDRASEIADNILNHWQCKTFGQTQTLIGSYDRQGETAPRYKAVVDIQAFHDHLHQV